MQHALGLLSIHARRRIIDPMEELIVTTSSVPGAPEGLHCYTLFAFPTLLFLTDGPCLKVPLDDNVVQTPEMSHTDTTMAKTVILKQ